MICVRRGFILFAQIAFERCCSDSTKCQWVHVGSFENSAFLKDKIWVPLKCLSNIGFDGLSYSSLRLTALFLNRKLRFLLLHIPFGGLLARVMYFFLEEI